MVKLMMQAAWELMLLQWSDFHSALSLILALCKLVSPSSLKQQLLEVVVFASPPVLNLKAAAEATSCATGLSTMTDAAFPILSPFFIFLLLQMDGQRMAMGKRSATTCWSMGNSATVEEGVGEQ